MCGRLSIKLSQASHTDVKIYDLYRLQGAMALEKLIQKNQLCGSAGLR